MGDRHALIIATGDYDDIELRKLKAPAKDAESLVTVLSDEAIGDFEVRRVIDRAAHEISLELETFFADRRLDDLLVLHLSCHGIKDDEGRLLFAAVDTKRLRGKGPGGRWLTSTTIPATFLKDLMDHCRARSIVLFLDCCYSGAFLPRSKGDSGVHLKERLEGQGRAILTASTEIEYAWEGDHILGEVRPSLFTAAVVTGLSTGQADRNGDGLVSVTELYDYVYDYVRRESRNRQSPKLLALNIENNVFLAKSAVPAPTPPRLPFHQAQELVRRLQAQARSNRMLGRIDGALASFSQVLELEPGNTEALRTRHEILHSLGREREVLDDLTRAIEIEPRHVPALRIRGEIYVNLGRPKEALDDLNRVLEIQSDDGVTCRIRGQAFLLMGRTKDAASDFQRTIYQDANDPIAHRYLGSTYIAMNQAKSGLEEISIAGEINLRNGQFQEALNDFSGMLEIESASFVALRGRGIAHFELNQFDDAINDLSIALSIQPEDVIALRYRGEANRMRNRLENALVDLSRALELDPDDEFARQSRGQIYQQLGMNKEAMQDFQGIPRRRGRGY